MTTKIVVLTGAAPKVFSTTTLTASLANVMWNVTNTAVSFSSVKVPMSAKKRKSSCSGNHF